MKNFNFYYKVDGIDLNFFLKGEKSQIICMRFNNATNLINNIKTIFNNQSFSDLRDASDPTDLCLGFKGELNNVTYIWCIYLSDINKSNTAKDGRLFLELIKLIREDKNFNVKRFLKNPYTYIYFK